VGILGWIVIEALGELIGRVLFEIGRAFLDRQLLLGLLAELSYLLFGLVLGGGSLWLLPQRVFSPSPLPGLSLILSAIGVGAVAALGGKCGVLSHRLGTWQAGAQFGFGVAVVRYLAFLR
jgi:hypothetical protein